MSNSTLSSSFLSAEVEITGSGFDLYSTSSSSVLPSVKLASFFPFLLEECAQFNQCSVKIHHLFSALFLLSHHCTVQTL